MIFPATVPRAELCLPLLLLCDRISWCRTVEEDDGGSRRSGADHFTKLPFCQARIPVPLGEARDSFLALRRDLRAQRGEFAARFGRLALAALGDSSQGVNESAMEILGELHGRGLSRSAVHPDDSVREALLWQARLVLELGAIIDEEDEALRRQLAQIQAQERMLFAGLRGDDAATGPASLPVVPPPPEDPAGERMLRLRLRAWTRLYTAGPAEARAEDLLLTDRPSAWERLRDSARRLGCPEPLVVAELHLPLVSATTVAKDFLARAAAFRQQLAGVLARLEPQLRSKGAALALAGSDIASWNEALRQHFPTSDSDGPRLVLARFTGVGASDLLRAAFAAADDPDQGTASPGTGVCLGFIHRAQ